MDVYLIMWLSRKSNKIFPHDYMLLVHVFVLRELYIKEAGMQDYTWSVYYYWLCTLCVCVCVCVDVCLSVCKLEGSLHGS